jgi:hypothetical protein
VSYERAMLERLKMPLRKDVEAILLKKLLTHGGVLREFGSGTGIEDEIADSFHLTEEQRSAYLETIFHKENRLKRSLLWHRLLFRAADSLAKAKMLSRPTETFKLNGRREWMLTELGYDEALSVCHIPLGMKSSLAIKSVEVQKIVKIIVDSPKPLNYNPIDRNKKIVKTTRESALRDRGFRQAVIEAYNFTCAVCGLKIDSPDSLSWEVEAAHIVPNNLLGRDDIWNGVALCHVHHWALDVGWFTFSQDYCIEVSSRIHRLPAEYGKMGTFDILRSLTSRTTRVRLPSRSEIFPDQNAILWHRRNIFLESQL